MNRLNADLILLAAAAIWGLAFLFQKSAMATSARSRSLPHGARSRLSPSLPLAILARACAGRRAACRAGSCRSPCGGGLLFFVAAWLQQAGLRTATVTNTGFLTALYVVITPFIAWAWNGKRPNPAVWPAMALSAFGTWLLGGGTLSALSNGDTLVALSAVFWAAHVVITGRASHFRPSHRIHGGPVRDRGGAGGRGPAPARDRDARGAQARGLVDIAYVGLLSSALTFTLLTVALQHTPPSEAVDHRQHGDGVCGGRRLPLLGERLGAIGWVGAALILAAILFVQLAAAIGARWRWN